MCAHWRTWCIASLRGETAYVVFRQIKKSEIDKDVLIKACAWIVLKGPEEGASDYPARRKLGWDDDAEEDALARASVDVRERKLLGAAGGGSCLRKISGGGGRKIANCRFGNAHWHLTSHKSSRPQYAA